MAAQQKYDSIPVSEETFHMLAKLWPKARIRGPGITAKGRLYENLDGKSYRVGVTGDDDNSAEIRFVVISVRRLSIDDYQRVEIELA